MAVVERPFAAGPARRSAGHSSKIQPDRAPPRVHRAVATRTDKRAGSFLDALHLAAIRRCLRFEPPSHDF